MVSRGNLSFEFLKTGDLYQALGAGTMLNQLLSHELDGSLNNIYLRVYLAEEIRFFPLMGIASTSRLSSSDQGLIWTGRLSAEEIGLVGDLEYTIHFHLTAQGIWFWTVDVEGKGMTVDVVYGQDLGLASSGAVRSNEAYLSQYIDHSVYEDKQKGYVICSRQNQPQAGSFPYIQQGSMTGSIGYSTDGFQFFGLSYKATNQPEILTKAKLANEIYQYEFAYTALQSEQVYMEGSARFVFYGLFKENHPEAVEQLEFIDEIQQAWEDVQSQFQKGLVGLAVQTTQRSSLLGEPLSSDSLTEEEMDLLYPQRFQEEWDGGTRLSFFTGTYEHVVLKEKELRVERPHGSILMSGDNARLNDRVMTTTSYMYGIFNSQVVVGNTNFNKMMTNARSALNIPKTSGQRIYVELDGQLRLLTMPAAFEMGFNYMRWIYKTDGDMLVVTNYTTVDSPEVRLHVRSLSGASYRYMVTQQISMNVAEYEMPYRIEQNGQVLSFRADPSSISSEVFPNLTYRLHMEGTKFQLEEESWLVEGMNASQAGLNILMLDAAPTWTITLQGLLDGVEIAVTDRTFEVETESYRKFFQQVMNGFHLSRSAEAEGDIFKVNALAWWYTHNMLVHYSMPHGLEQYGGAAWGTRDVCQGPTEYFLATQKYDQVRDILLKVYSHQYEDSGNWPQWFMFDAYTKIQQEESHGDIIVWPLKIIGDYLAASHDFAILDQQVPYTRKHDFDFTEQTFAIREHVLKELEYIKHHFLHDTKLSSYGDGDWDDTLQPANEQLKQYMVSSWTVALTYQAVHQLAEVLQDQDAAFAKELAELAQGIQHDFNQYMLQTDVIPGFVYLEDPDHAKLMVHPTDEETGIQYRLLPMTRSIISELLTPEQALAHYEIIQDQLLCPDGVRLMNRPAQYAGGVSTHFKRAEQAANFGREIGLQYVHAHIRYIEAMAKMGKPEQVWHGLEAINPVGIQDVVPNAELRQSNAYFSSSDGKFATRYEAQEHFDKLRTGAVPVKGGWRIYSSGPGIYMNQLITNALGIRTEGTDLVIDPVLSASQNGLQFTFEYAGVPVTFTYHYTDGQVRKVHVNGQEAQATTLTNPYRGAGLRINRAVFEKLTSNEEAIVDIYI
ncbi:GH36-type glycosyl hydrolase domain-containing protein [Paenibacillus shirakamiensis]|nr:amylo-alpha-1,6-glucosidase [Paenibacillus shirakamiensis]